MSSPFSISITDHVMLEWTGEPGLESLRSALMQITTHESFRNGMPIVSVDLHSVYNPAELEIRAIAAELGANKQLLGRVAMVVRSMVHYGIGNMLRVHAQSVGVELSVFLDITEALSWARGQPLEQNAGA